MKKSIYFEVIAQNGKSPAHVMEDCKELATKLGIPVLVVINNVKVYVSDYTDLDALLDGYHAALKEPKGLGLRNS